MDPLLLDRLHQTNPWLFGQGSVRDAALARPPERWVDRRQVDLSGLLRPGRAHLIVGPRQAGKSSLAWSLLRRLDRPLYVDLEEPVFRQWCTSAVQFLADLRALGLPPDAVLLEEAQRLSDAALFVKGLVDNRAPFPVLVTGSSSFQLQDRTRESLAGRATRHLLLPLSLEEVTPRRPDEPRATLEVRRRRSLARHVRVGGYPEAWTDDHPAAVLSGLVQAVVLHDASDLSRVERPDAYQRLLELCAHRVGNLLVVSELASVCGVAAATAARYLTLMEDMHVLRLVPAFADGRRREVTSARKTFFVDTGLAGAGFTAPESTLEKAGIGVDWAQAHEAIGGGGTFREVDIVIDRLTLGTGSDEVIEEDVPGKAIEHSVAILEDALGFHVGALISHQFFRSHALTFDITGMRLVLRKGQGH